jgi:hypothetical protein
MRSTIYLYVWCQGLHDPGITTVFSWQWIMLLSKLSNLTWWYFYAPKILIEKKYGSLLHVEYINYIGGGALAKLWFTIVDACSLVVKFRIFVTDCFLVILTNLSTWVQCMFKMYESTPTKRCIHLYCLFVNMRYLWDWEEDVKRYVYKDVIWLDFESRL